ncbi:MAG: hypothetical protein K2Y21_09710 [Phycisphaerales bacterium]|nr:hypothetical protein [Phycisphaerales bacterium]
MIRRSAVRMGAAALCAAVAGLAMAAPPSGEITYQGRLSDNGGNANGSYNLVFRFFSVPFGGTEICNTSKPGTTVTGGVFTTSLGPTVTDGPSGGVYTDLADVFKTFSTLYVQVEVNGTPVTPRTRLLAAPAAVNADRAHSLADVAVVSGSTWTVDGVAGALTIAGTNLRLQLGDTTLLTGSLRMRAPSLGDGTQSIFFLDGGSETAESFSWDDGQGRFELTDQFAITGPLSVGSLTGALDAYNRFGTQTSTSGAMNNIADVFVGGDVEVASNLISQGDIRLRSGLAEGDGVIYFREDASDTGENFRWDDSADGFAMTDDLFVDGNITFNGSGTGVANLQSAGGVTIRFDTDNNESGPNAGVFSLNIHAPNVLGTPLLRMQSSDEANLELDAGVTTNAFDFAEAFRPVAHEMDMEPGDVVALAVGGANKEHVELTTQAGQAMLLGVVSTKPAFTCGMGISAVQEADADLAALQQHLFESGDLKGVAAVGELLDVRMRQEWKPIAMLGRVPCKVDTQFGVIKAGDRVTSSPTKGHAMKQTGPGMSLGIAMEDANQPGKIMVLVRPMWYGGSAQDFGNIADRVGDHANSAAVINASHTTKASEQPAQDSARIAELEAETKDLKARLADLERFVTAQMQGNKVVSQR